MFGIVWGITSVILLVGLGKGFSRDQKERLKTIGVDLAIIWGGRTSEQARGYAAGREVVNRGYQQFVKTSKTELPATADQLKSLQSFSEELKVGLGLPSLYNESLGTVSEAYQYDRIKDRDKPAADRPKRPWEVAGKKAVAAKKGRA